MVAHGDRWRPKSDSDLGTRALAVFRKLATGERHAAQAGSVSSRVWARWDLDVVSLTCHRFDEFNSIDLICLVICTDSRIYSLTYFTNFPDRRSCSSAAEGSEHYVARASEYSTWYTA